MAREKRVRGFALPAIDASPEEIAQAIFRFDPAHSLPSRETGQAPGLYVEPPLSITVPKGSATHRWLEEQETEEERRAAAGSE